MTAMGNHVIKILDYLNAYINDDVSACERSWRVE